MKQRSKQALATHHHLFFTVIFAVFSFYAFLHWNDPVFLQTKPTGHGLNAPTTALTMLFLAIYCGIGYTIYNDRLVMCLFGLPLRTLTWDQFSAVECITAEERTQMTKLRFHTKSSNSRTLTIPIHNKDREKCLQILKECLGPIWMPKEKEAPCSTKNSNPT